MPTQPSNTRRRSLLQAGAALALGASPFATSALATSALGAPVLPSTGTGTEAPWDAGDLAHLLPTVSHDRMLIKLSFHQALASAPQLRVQSRAAVTGQRTDTEGRFWQFDVSGLRPATTYTLRLHDAKGKPLCAAWPLRTFPSPDASPERLRVLAYTCAGGHPDLRGPGGIEAFRTLAIRHALLDRALSFRPNAVIANGDHVYWDQRTWMEAGNAKVRAAALAFNGKIGMLERGKAVFGTENERVLKKAVDPQIAALYGVRLRSTPVFFFNDDHDYFENDEADESYVTFPPEHFELELARAVQHMYYPEFLPDQTRTLELPGSNAADRPAGVSECFGTLRFGKLAEVLMYDCGRYLSLKDKFAGLVPSEAERWLLERTAADDTRHLVHMPSTPVLWSVGKWREWYPDVVLSDETAAAPGDTVMVRWSGVTGDNLRLSTQKKKYMWQPGWYAQHQRIVKAMSAGPRPAVQMSGDLHATGWDRIIKSGELDLSGNPITVVLNGTLGTGMAGWPSGPRGISPTQATSLVVERKFQPLGKR